MPRPALQSAHPSNRQQLSATVSKLFVQVIFFASAFATNGCSEGSNGAGGVAASAASVRTHAMDRANQLKALLDTHREISGGHSPVPARAITINSIDAVRPTLTDRDADALVELTLDDRADVRSAAVHLLSGLDAQADRRLQARMHGEQVKNKRDRLESALLDLKVLRAAPQAAPASR